MQPFMQKVQRLIHKNHSTMHAFLNITQIYTKEALKLLYWQERGFSNIWKHWVDTKNDTISNN